MTEYLRHTPRRVMVVGHSLISRLGQYASASTDRHSFGLTFDDVKFFGIPGGSVFDITKKITTNLQCFTPDVVCCQIGGNDLSHPGAKVEVVVDRIGVTVNDFLRNVHVKHVSVCELFVRAKTRAFKGDVSIDVYNDRVRKVNSLLQAELCSDEVTFWSHSREIWDVRQLYAQDGVHFTNNKPFYRSMKGCVIQALKHC